MSEEIKSPPNENSNLELIFCEEKNEEQVNDVKEHTFEIEWFIKTKS